MNCFVVSKIINYRTLFRDGQCHIIFVACKNVITFKIAYRKNGLADFCFPYLWREGPFDNQLREIRVVTYIMEYAGHNDKNGYFDRRERMWTSFCDRRWWLEPLSFENNKSIFYTVHVTLFYSVFILKSDVRARGLWTEMERTRSRVSLKLYVIYSRN